MKRAWVSLLACVACKQDPAPAPSASASSSTVVPAASAIASTAVATGGPVAYAGSYTATPGTLFVPDASAWDGVKFRGDTDAGSLGEGTLTFTLDTDAGTLSGDLQGPLGPATLTGSSQGDAFSFQVAPKERTDLAFSGTGTGMLDGGAAIGDIHVSSWRANVLRDATFRLEKKK